MNLKYIKKLILFSLIISVIGNLPIASYAKSSIINNIKPTIEVYSKDFPDAYIEQVFIPNKVLKRCPINLQNGKKVIGDVLVTIYVDEKTEKINGKKVCTSSRLMSSAEVKTNRLNNRASIDFIDDDEDTKHRLHLRLRVIAEDYGSRGVKYGLTSTAAWNSSPAWGITDAPAMGEDFISLEWGRQFDSRNESLTVNYLDQTSTRPSTYKFDIDKGVIWKFPDQKGNGPLGNMDGACASANLFKNRLTGHGNTTSVTSTYVHTFVLVTPSVSFGSNSGVLSISPNLGSWQFAIKVSDLPY